MPLGNRYAGNVPCDIELHDFTVVDADVVVHGELPYEDIKSIREPEKLSDGEDNSSHDTPASVAPSQVGDAFNIKKFLGTHDDIAMAPLTVQESLTPLLSGKCKQTKLRLLTIKLCFAGFIVVHC